MKCKKCRRELRETIQKLRDKTPTKIKYLQYFYALIDLEQRLEL